MAWLSASITGIGCCCLFMCVIAWLWGVTAYRRHKQLHPIAASSVPTDENDGTPLKEISLHD